jgi:predicted Zn-dependent peptidase
MRIEKFPNGLTLLVDSMCAVRSAAYSLIVPGGIVGDPADQVGQSLVLADLLSKGAGSLDSRAFSDRLDFFGIAHAEFAAETHMGLQGHCRAEALGDALDLLSKMVVSPHLPSEYVPLVQNLLQQDFDALEDDPVRRTLLELCNLYLPAPYNRPSTGTRSGIGAVTQDSLRERQLSMFRPDGMVLAVAGSLCFEQVLESVAPLLGQVGRTESLPRFCLTDSGSRHFIQSHTNQTQIAMAFAAPKFTDADHYLAEVAQQILSGGTFGRLFVEARERRGLCYSIFGRYMATPLYGMNFVHAATSPERASELLNVLEQELTCSGRTVTQEELAVAKANLKASIFLGEDSTLARAIRAANHWCLSGKLHSLPEIDAIIDSIELDAVSEYMQICGSAPRTLLVVGPEDI